MARSKRAPKRYAMPNWRGDLLVDERDGIKEGGVTIMRDMTKRVVKTAKSM